MALEITMNQPKCDYCLQHHAADDTRRSDSSGAWMNCFASFRGYSLTRRADHRTDNMTTKLATITVGPQCCGHFRGQADIVVGYHCERRWPCGRVEKGVYLKRRWLADRAAFEYDPRLGWAREFWFKWKE